MIDLLRFSSLLLLVGPVLLLLSAIGLRTRISRPAALALLCVAYGVPALITLAICLIWRVPATRVVIELRGVAFRSIAREPLQKRVTERMPGSGQLSIGDSASRRTSTPSQFGTLVFHPGTGDAKGTLSVTLPPPEVRAGLIAAGKLGILGSETIGDGDRICLQSSCWTYDASTESFDNGANGVLRLPQRQARIPILDWTFPLPWAAPARAAARTYSLEAMFAGPGRTEPLRSFICHSNPGPALRLVVLDRGITLLRDDRAVPANTSFDLEENAHLSFYSLPRHASSFENPGIIERRSVRVHNGTHSFALELDTPEVRSITVDELNALELRSQDPRPKTKIVGLAMGNAQMTDRSLYFTGISEAVALQASSLIELSRMFPRDFTSAYGIVSPRGPMTAALADVAWIGATDLAAFRMHVLRPPLLLLLFGLVVQLLKIVSAYAARLTNQQALFAGALECLVAVRLLVGYRIWSMPPHDLEAAELGLVAWMALPWMYLAASVVPVLPSRRNGPILPSVVQQAWLPTMMGLIFSAVFCAMATKGPRRWVWIACHLGAAAVGVLRNAMARQWLVARTRRIAAAAKKRTQAATTTVPAVIVRKHVSADRPWLRAVTGAAAALLVWILVREAVGLIPLIVLMALAFAAAWFRVRIGEWLQPLRDPELRPYHLFALSFCAGRLLLLLFGWKESIPLGTTRVALSAVHVPAAAVLQGAFFWTMYRRVTRHGVLRAADLAAAVSILVFVWIIPAALTSDIGLALLNVPVFAIVFLDAVRGAAKSRRATLVPWILATGVLVFIAIAPIWRLVIPLLGDEEAMLKRASDSNFVRFIHFAEPERLRELATKRGESLAVTSAILQRYIDSGLTGYGYGRSDTSPHLGATALRDFAPAVFIAGEWGLAGTMALLLLYTLFFVIGRAGAPWDGKDSGEPRSRAVARAVTFTTAATIATASIYMILANHELLLLTGKNAYLLGLDSAGDVLEVMALVLVIALGCGAASETAPESTGPPARQWWTS